MADAYISVVPAAVGGGNINMQTYQNPVNGNTVQIEAIALVDPTGLNSVGVTNGALNVYLAVIQANAGANLNTSALAVSSAQTNGGQKTQVCDPVNSSNIAGVTNGALNVYLNAIVANAGTNLNTAALALSATQTNGGQKTQICDPVNSSNVAGITNGALNVYLGTINPVTVIQTNALNLSANVSGTVSATQSGTWNIGTITSLSGNVGTKETPDSTSTYCPSTSTSPGYESNRVVKSSAGVLYGLTCHNGRASQQYILLFNTTSLPADGTAPNFPPLNVPAGQTFSLDFPKFGRYFSTGIVICNSTTNATKTLGGNDCWFDAMYA